MLALSALSSSRFSSDFTPSFYLWHHSHEKRYQVLFRFFIPWAIEGLVVGMGDIQNSYNDYCQLYNHDYHEYRHVFLQIYKTCKVNCNKAYRLCAMLGRGSETSLVHLTTFCEVAAVILVISVCGTIYQRWQFFWIKHLFTHCARF